MKAIAWIALIIFPALLAAEADPNDPDALVPVTNLQKEIHAIYRYEPHPRPYTPKPPPFLVPKESAPARPDFDQTPPAEPRNVREMRRLDAAIVQEKADARKAEVAKNLGIGLQTVPLGGPWYAGAATAFYIPVLVDVGFHW
ncbi:MAG TPA: hypothetical protein VGF85_05155 [Opitutaceae bacterium]|jgi:hypothetical protein